MSGEGQQNASSHVGETLNMVCVVVGTLVLLFMLSRSGCFGEVMGCGCGKSGCNCAGFEIKSKNRPQGKKRERRYRVKEGLEVAGDATQYERDVNRARTDASVAMCLSSTNNYEDAMTCLGMQPTAEGKLLGQGRQYVGYDIKDLASRCAGVTDDYMSAIQCMGLEPGVQSSHKKWISKLRHRTTTASKETVRDDPNDINPWVGLRRPKYKTLSQPGEGARQTNSTPADQMLDSSNPFVLY